MIWAGLDNRLGVEVAKSRGLERELNEVEASLLKECIKHDTLCVAI